MTNLTDVIPTALSVSSIAVSMYVWLIKMNGERPRFRVVASSPVERTASMKGWRTARTELLRGFVRGDAAEKQTSPAGVGSYCFLFRSFVVNQSTIPHAIGSVRVLVKRADGTWMALNTAFVPLDSNIGGPFNLNWENPPGRGPIEPRSFVVTPDQGFELKLLAWFDIPLGTDVFTWSRVGTDGVPEAVASFGASALAQPLAMR